MYHLTNFPLYLSFTVHYFYTKISSFKQLFILKNCFELFYPLFFLFWEILNLNLPVCRNNITWSLNSLFRITFTANMNLCTMWPRFPLLVSYFYKIKNSCITLFLSVRIVLDCFYVLIFSFENFINLNLSDVCRKQTLNPFNSMVSGNHTCVSRINFHFNRYGCFLCAR